MVAEPDVSENGHSGVRHRSAHLHTAVSDTGVLIDG